MIYFTFIIYSIYLIVICADEYYSIKNHQYDIPQECINNNIQLENIIPNKKLFLLFKSLLHYTADKPLVLNIGPGKFN